MRAFASPVAVAVVAIVAATAAAGCSSPPAGAMFLSWQFADQRDCFSSGAVVIEARTQRSLATAALASFRCTLGTPPASVTLDPVPGSGTLHVDARSAGGADLYHGELSLESYPPGTDEVRLVTLFAAAAQ